MDNTKKEYISEDDVRSIFHLTGFKVEKVWRLSNKYYSYSPHEDEADTRKNAVYRERRPWWLVKTEHGLIEIGPRKHVIQIEWSCTNVQCIVTEDKVTKGNDYVHAENLQKIIEYLSYLNKFIREIK
jgi:hypothetical protein